MTDQQGFGATDPVMNIATGFMASKYLTDPTHTQPALATLLAGTFLTGYGEGDVYSENEVTEWLADTGWRKVAIEMLAGPARLIVATTV